MRKDLHRDAKIRKVGAALLGLVQQIETAYEHSASSNKMHPTDFRAICLLGGSGRPMSPKEMGTFLGLTSGAVSALIGRLEANGFIARKSNPEDRRSVLVVLNEEAAARPLLWYRILRERHVEVTENLTDDKLEAIARYLDDVREITLRHSEATDL